LDLRASRHVAGAVLTSDRQRVVVQPAHAAFVAEVPAEARAAVPTPFIRTS
jgi:hypothetical protein